MATARIATLKKANKLLRLALRVAARPLRRRKSPVVVIHSDAAWGCRRDGSSQGGYLCFMTDAEFAKGAEGPASLVSWNTGKFNRLARSSLAAEIQAARTRKRRAISCASSWRISCSAPST